MANNPKHVFDFETLLSVEINQKNWKEVKRKLGEEFEKLRLAIDEGLAKEEAQKVLDIFNRKFAEASIPININFEDLKKDLAKVEESISAALASLNKIDTSALKGIETSLENIEGTLKDINRTAGNIFDNMGKGARDASKEVIKSASEIERALKRVGGKKGGRFKEIKNLLEGSPGTSSADSPVEIKNELEDAVKKRNDVAPEAEWEDRYIADIEFANKYRAIMKRAKAFDAKKLKELKDANFSEVYQEAQKIFNQIQKNESVQRDMLQNIVNMGLSTPKRQKPLVGYDGGEPWARDDTLKEVRDILKGGIKVSDDGTPPADGGKENNAEQKPKNKKKEIDAFALDFAKRFADEAGKIDQKQFDDNEPNNNTKTEKYNKERRELVRKMMSEVAVADGAEDFDLIGLLEREIIGTDNPVEAKKLVKKLSGKITPIQPKIEPKAVEQEIKENIGAEPVKVSVEPVAENIDVPETQHSTAEGGAKIDIDEASLGNAIANALKSAQLNVNAQGEVKASIDATELKGALHDGTPYDVRIVKEGGEVKPKQVSLTDDKRKKMRMDTPIGKLRYKQNDNGELDSGFVEWATGSIYNNPNFLNEIYSYAIELEEKLAPVKEMVGRISANSSIEGITDIAEEASNVAQRISTMYDEGITDSEEFITLQLKLSKLLDAYAEQAGGVKGSGAKSAAELRRWIYESIESKTGYNIGQSKVPDAMWSEDNSLALYSGNSKKRSLYTMAGQALGYSGSKFFSGYEAKEDHDTLAAIKKILPAVQTIATEMQGGHASPGESDAVAINEEQLRGVLSGITYNVKVAHESEPESKPIAIDETSLEGVLNRVLGNITPTSSENEPWALEGTLQTVRDVLAQIQTSIANIGTSEAQIKRILTNKYSVRIVDDSELSAKKASALSGEIEELKNRTYKDLIELEDINSQIASKEAELANIKPSNTVTMSALEELLNRIIPQALGSRDGKGGSGDTASGQALSSIKEILERMFAAISHGPDKNPERDVIDEVKLGESIGRVISGINTAGNGPWALEDTLKNETNSLLSAILESMRKVSIRPVEDGQIPGTTMPLINVGPVEPLYPGAGKQSTTYKPDGTPIIGETKQKSKTETSIQTVVGKYIFDKHGNPDLALVEIIDDFEGLDKERKTEAQKIDLAKAKLKEFLAQFNNKTLGRGKDIEGFSDLENLSNDPNFDLQSIETAKQMMAELNARYNELVRNFRRGGSSLNPFVNAINNVDKLENKIRVIQLDLKSLEGAPDDLVEEVKGLKPAFEDARGKLEAADIKGYSEAYGELREKIVQITEKIRIFKKEQKLDVPKAEVNKLIKLNEELGSLLAQRDAVDVSSEEYRAVEKLIEAKEEEIAKKRESVKVDSEMLENAKQRGQEEKKLAILREKAHAEDAKAARDEKKAFKDSVKISQREARLTKTNSAIGRAWDTLSGATSIEGLSPDSIANLEKYSDEIERLNNDYKTLKYSGEEITADQATGLQKQTTLVNNLTAEVKSLIAEYDRLSGDNVEEIDADIVDVGNLQAYKMQLIDAVNVHTHGQAKIKGFDAATKSLTYTVSNGKHEITEYTAAVRRLDGRFVSVQGATKHAETFLEASKRKLSQISSYLSAMSLYGRAVQELRKGIQYIREIDVALTELKKVTDETEESYNKFLNTAAKTANKIGSTIKDVVAATAEFAKLGYEMEQAHSMAEAAIVYMNVGDGINSVDEASASIISTLKAFDMKAEESMNIVSKFNEVGNNFSITSKGIGDALQNSASALVSAGNTIDESIGLITAANSVVQDPTAVGTALKTLSLRIRGAKTELEEAGLEVEGMVETVSTLQAKLLGLTGGKVDIMLDANTFKSTTQIIREMAEVWSSMTDVQQAAALELMGGKRQANVLSALIYNFDMAEEAIESSINSRGSALKENEEYLNSIQGKIDLLTNSIQTMWQNMLNSDAIKAFIDIGNQLVKVLDTLGPIKVLVAAIFTYFSKKYNILNLDTLFDSLKKVADISKGRGQGIKGFFKTLKSGFKNGSRYIDSMQSRVNKLEDELKSLDGMESEKSRRKKDSLMGRIDSYKREIKAYNDLVEKKSLADEEVVKAEARLAENIDLKERALRGEVGELSDADLTSLNDGIKEAELNLRSAEERSQKLGTAINKTGSFGKSAFKGLAEGVKNFAKQAASALAQMLLMWAISKVIEVVSDAINKAVVTAEEAAEKFEELTNQLKDTKSELEGINDELKTLDDKIAELTAKGKLSFTEQEELERLREERAELERELELKKALAQQQQEQVNSQTSDQVEYYKNKGTKSGKTAGERVEDATKTAAIVGGSLTAAAGLAAFGGSMSWNLVGWIALAAAAAMAATAGISYAVAKGEETVGDSIDNMGDNLKKKEDELEKARDAYQDSGSDKDKKKYEEAQQALSDYRGEMSKYFAELGAYYDNVDLSEVEDPERYAALKKEMNDFYNERDKWLIESGSEGATSNAIERVFDKKENKKAKEDIEALMEQLKEDPGNTAIEQKIKNIINGSGTLKADFEAIGIKIDDVARSFTQMAEDQLFGTIDGKVEELERATAAFKNLLNGEQFNFEGKNIGLADLFTDEGKVIQTKLSGIFKNTSSETREAITGLLERSYDDIQNGTVKIETLLGEFAARGSEAILSILQETSDTFEEISENMDKIQSSYSTLSNAVEQYNSAGFLTLDNLQSLLSLEPEYLALLQMENGQLTINQAGYEALVQTKLAEAKASVVQSAMKQLNALAAKNEADATNAASTAAANSISNLGTYASALSDVAKNAIGAAGAVYAFNNAVTGAQANELVTQEEIDAIINSMDTQLQMIDSVGANLSTNFSGIMTGGEGGSPKDGGEDASAWEELLKKYQDELDALAHQKDLIQAEIDEAEAKGFIASEEYYKKLIALEREEQSALVAKQRAMQAFYDANSAAMSADEIDEWNSEMRETALAIKEAEANMIEFGNTIREIDAEYFGRVSEDIDNINEEIEFMHGLLEDEPVADEDGNWSNEALTRLGLYTQQMERAAFETQRAKDELAELQATTSEADKNTDWYREREEELTQAIYDGVNSYNDAKDGIVELNEARVEAIKEGIEQEISAMEDLISLKKEELDAERD